MSRIVEGSDSNSERCPSSADDFGSVLGIRAESRRGARAGLKTCGCSRTERAGASEVWLGGRDSNPDNLSPESDVLPLNDLPAPVERVGG